MRARSCGGAARLPDAGGEVRASAKGRVEPGLVLSLAGPALSHRVLRLAAHGRVAAHLVRHVARLRDAGERARGGGQASRHAPVPPQPWRAQQPRPRRPTEWTGLPGGSGSRPRMCPSRLLRPRAARMERRSAVRHAEATTLQRRPALHAPARAPAQRRGQAQRGAATREQVQLWLRCAGQSRAASRATSRALFRALVSARRREEESRRRPIRLSRRSCSGRLRSPLLLVHDCGRALRSLTLSCAIQSRSSVACSPAVRRRGRPRSVPPRQLEAVPVCAMAFSMSASISCRTTGCVERMSQRWRCVTRALPNADADSRPARSLAAPARPSAARGRVIVRAEVRAASRWRCTFNRLTRISQVPAAPAAPAKPVIGPKRGATVRGAAVPARCAAARRGGVG